MSGPRLAWTAGRGAAPAPVPLAPPLRVLSRQIEHAVGLVGEQAVADLLAHTAQRLGTATTGAPTGGPNGAAR